MKSQELDVSEYIYVLIALVVIVVVQIAFSCYCCYAVFFKTALRCPCGTSSRCLCKQNVDTEKNPTGTETEISTLEEVPSDQVKEVTRTSRCSKILARIKTKYNESKKARVVKNVRKRQAAENTVSVHIEKKHGTMNTPAKRKNTENETKSVKTNRAEVVKNVQKSQADKNEVSIPIEEKHETMNTPAKRKTTENTTKSDTTNRARTTIVPVVKKDTNMSVVVQVTRH